MTIKPLKILYHIPYASGTGADRWIYEGWRDAFIDLGYEFHELSAFDDLEAKSQAIQPDIFMTGVNLLNFKRDAQKIINMRQRGTKVFMGIWWPLPASLAEAQSYLLSQDLVDIYFGERELEGMADFNLKANKPYVVIPNAANKMLHYPAKPVSKYQYDIVYLGAKLPLKKRFFDDVLLPLSRRYKVGIFGPYWTLKDNFYRLMVKGSKYLNLAKSVDFFNKLRIQIPVNEENQLYSSAKICLNFHEREPDGSQPHYIINQRAFKIPACGGFQLCDRIPALSNYFAQNEIALASATHPQEWFDLIDFYLKNDKERETMRANGTKRALECHTYHNRVAMIQNLYHQLSG